MRMVDDGPSCLAAAPEVIAVAFVNYHSEQLIGPRAAQFARAGFEVLVADNSNTYDGGGTVVAMSGNEGFGAGCNRAAAAAPASSRYLCFHNPDVEIDPECVVRMAESLGHVGRPGAVAPAESTFGYLRVAGYHYPSTVREAVLCGRAVVRSWGPLGGGPSASTRRPSSLAPGARWGGTRGRRFPGGGLLVVDRRAHEALGGFDERYFLYAEDLDYWHRLTCLGYSATIDPTFVAEHEVSTGSPLAADRREILRWLGVELFLQKFEPQSLRLVRLAHRASLAVLGCAWPEVALPVSTAWRQSATPAECLDRIRPILTGS